MGDGGRRVTAALVAAALGIGAAALLVGPGEPRRVAGRVVDATGAPVPGATVRIQATAADVATDERGRFHFTVPPPATEIALTAWAEGSYVTGGETHRPGDVVVLTLLPVPETDDPSYRWLSYRSGGAATGTGRPAPQADCVLPFSDEDGPRCRGVLGDPDTGDPAYLLECTARDDPFISRDGMADLDCALYPVGPEQEGPLPEVECRYSALTRRYPPPMECVLVHTEPDTGGRVSEPAPVLASPFDPGAATVETLATEASACANCHARAAAGTDADLPVDQWLQDAHGRSAANHRFLTMYLGTDVDGNASPPTRFTENRDYGAVPLPPDPALPYHGPGYRLDFPDSFGNCAACHTPAAAVGDPYGVDPTTVTGVAAEGIGCDFCHKVSGVALDPETSTPAPNMPGVLSLEFLRPPEGHQYFAGPYDDVAPGEDTFVPLYLESAYCAACHHGVFWDTLVYDSYGEWLASPYADPASGSTCQDCHMPPTGATVFASPEAGGLERDPDTIAGHLMPGAADEALLASAVTMTAEAGAAEGTLVVTVSIVNDRTGHHVPTDSPLRHLILLVDAAGPQGPLTLLEGPVVPDWGGVGDPANGRYAGLPGTAYAKVLEEVWTGVSPTGAYWNQTRVISDNRIPAMGSDTTTYRFALPDGASAEVDVTLVYRRAFADLADQKGWGLEDTVMAAVSLAVP